jgi:hypothetical protein
MKTEAEAFRYAIDWLRAFPALPTTAPEYQEERRQVVAKLEEMLAAQERFDRRALYSRYLLTYGAHGQSTKEPDDAAG